MPFNKDGKRKKHPYKRNPYTNSPIGDLSGDKVYGPATAVIAAGKKFIKGSKDLVKGAAQAGKTLRKAVKKSKNITGTGGPFMMKPGSREKNTPGSFREEVAPMYYNKKPMNFIGKDKISKPHTLTEGRSKASQAISNIKGKLKSPSFQKDLGALTTVASILPVGRAAGGVGKVGKAIKKAVGKSKKVKPTKGSFKRDPYTKHRERLMKEGMSKKEVFKRFPTKDMMTPQQLKNIARAAGKSMPSGGNFRPIVTGNKVYDKKSINKAFKSRFGKPKK